MFFDKTNGRFKKIAYLCQRNKQTKNYKIKMKKTLLTLLALLMASTTFAQSEKANEVMNTLRLANNYFMAKYADPTLPTNVNRIRPSSLIKTTATSTIPTVGQHSINGSHATA